MIAYKLFRVRADGSLGPLFINRRQRIPVGVWIEAETHPTAGYTVRHGWHASATPNAPHLSTKGRAWYVVQLQGVTPHLRPARQGGLWWTGKRMRVVVKVSEGRKR